MGNTSYECLVVHIIASTHTYTVYQQNYTYTLHLKRYWQIYKMYWPCIINLRNTFLLNLFLHWVVALATVQDLSAFPSKLYFQKSGVSAKIHIYSLQTAVALSSFKIDSFDASLQGIFKDGNAYMTKSIIENKGSKMQTSSPGLNRGDWLLHVHCSCRRLSVTVSVSEPQSKASL